MTDPAPLPSFRLKLPCADEAEFREKYLQKYVAKGVFVPSDHPKPVGARLRLKVEIRSGAVLVSGDGIVTAIVQPGGTVKPGMTVRLTTLHADSIQFSLSPSTGNGAAPAGAKPAAVPAAARPPAPALTPPPALKRPTPPAQAKPQPPPPPAPTPPPSKPAAAPAPGLLDDLFVPAAASAPVATATPASALGAAPEPAPVDAADLVEPEPELPDLVPPTLTAPGAAASAPAGARRLALGRRSMIFAGTAILILGIVVAVGVVSARRSRVERAQTVRIDEQLRVADLRLLEGRLAGSGGDSALDHLLEAKGLAPADERVSTRLKLLADKFEQLGDRALARKNLREASVHFRATLLADPARATARARLDEIDSKTQRGATDR